jgi:hypothetical protein
MSLLASGFRLTTHSGTPSGTIFIDYINFRRQDIVGGYRGSTSRSMMRSRLSSKPISSALLRVPATTALGERGSYLKTLLMKWTYLPLQRIIPELCARR